MITKLRRYIRRRLNAKRHGQSIFLNYPTSADNSPRWGYGRPPNDTVYQVLNSYRSEYQDLLEKLLAFKEKYTEKNTELEDYLGKPILTNPWLPGLDSFCLYTMIAFFRPRIYMEIGSGISTKIARASIDDHQLETKIISIDPSPRTEIDAICDRVERSPLETQDMSLFGRLAEDDMLFFDGSHRAFMNSDATVFFLEVLPSLGKGVLVQIHDIFLPDDYPPDWRHRYYSEQYLLASYLLAGHRNFDVLLPNAFIARDPSLHSMLDVVFGKKEMAEVSSNGGSFWLRTTSRQA